MTKPLEIAVVGTGIGGLASAWLLARRHRVTVYEAADRPGGHAHTHDVTVDGVRFPVDSGFIVYNHATYPNFVRLLAQLGVPGKRSDMSFGVRCRRCRLEYSSRGPGGLFAQPRRLLDPRHWRLLADIPRFNARARAFLEAGCPGDPDLGEFIAGCGVSDGFVRHFLLPMGAAIWSSPNRDVVAFPARSFLTFFANHGWLTVDGAHQWWTVEGGSRAYVEALVRQLPERALRLNAPVRGIAREAGRVAVRTEAATERFDEVVIATHADQALALLADPSDEERRLLGAFRYSRNRATLHADREALPRARGAWASWNCDLDDCRDDARPVSLTYHMNRLQSLPVSTPVGVTLNGTRVAPERVLAEMTYTHPILDRAAVEAQEPLKRLSGARGTFYAGAHLRYGFHEDGLMSALWVAEHHGITL